MVVQIPFINLKFANIIDIKCRRGLSKYRNVSRQLSTAPLKGVAPLKRCPRNYHNLGKRIYIYNGIGGSVCKMA